MKRTPSEPSIKPASARTLFRRQSGRAFLQPGGPLSSNGDETEPSKGIKAATNIVHGLPDFENPLEGRPSVGDRPEGGRVVASMSIASSNRDRLAPRKPQRSPSAQLLDDRKVTTPHTLVASEQKVLDCEATGKMQASSCYNQDEHKSFENMIIECDDDGSEGELTYDGSIMHDEGYWRNQYLQRQQENLPLRQESLEQRQSQVVSPSRNAIPSLTSVPSRDHSSYRSRSNSQTSHVLQADHRARQLSIEEEEQLLIELAMERSLHDSYSGSMSISDSHVSSASDYRSRTSAGSSISQCSNLGSTGCDFTVVCKNGNGRFHNRSSLERSDRATANNSIWKRDGKKWQKIPVHGNHHHHPGHASASGDLALHAIKEVDNENLNDSYHHSQHQRHYMEDLHQHKADEVLNRSLTAQLNRSSGNWSTAENSFADEEEVDQAMILARRLQELEQEKVMIERALEGKVRPRAAPVRSKSTTNSLTLDNRPSIERRASFQAKPRAVSIGPSDVSMISQESAERYIGTTASLSSAGCHLAMIASLHHGNSSSGLYRSNSKQPKLVWKRGPNNTWGRFPDDGNDCDRDVELSIQDREEALLAEALMRSLSDM